MKLRTFINITAVLVASIGGTVSAQNVYTLEMCREMALKNNKAGAIAELTAEKTGYDSKAYLANFFPKISASGAYLFTNMESKRTIKGNYLPTFVPDPATGQLKPNVLTMPDGTPLMGADGNPVFREYAYFPDMSLDLRTNGTYFAGIRAEQPIYMGGKISSAYKMSLIGKEIAELNKDLTRAEIIVKTDEAYWLHLKAVESRKVAKAFQEVVGELLRNVENAQKAGMRSRNDVLKVQVQANKAELQMMQVENAVRLSRMNLWQIIAPSNSPQGQEMLVSDDLKTDTRISPSGGVEARPESSILDKQIELKSQQIKLVRSDFLPNIGVMGNYGYIHGVKLNDSPLFDQASLSALVTVSIPIFHWGEGMNKIRAARAEKQIMQLKRDDLSEKMELERIQTLDKLNESELEVTMTVRALEQAEENMRTSREHYEAGMETLADYLEAQTLWQQAWLENINAKINQKLNHTYYLKTIGEL
ncbi:MAG: TolC family protein [Tannerella sp.]|jgi:outer membrane protein TolC|nr:TolC family protein [Tannerella sp.]